MKKLVVSSLLLGVWALGHSKVIAQTTPKDSLILPGASVAGLRLGSDSSSFEAIFPKRPGSNDSAQTGTFGEGCPNKIYYWSDLGPDPSGVTAYLKSGEISQISVQGQRFSLPSGLKVGATEGQVRQAYPQGRSYVLLYSGSKVNGGRNLVYWVDKQAGIAFEFAWSQDKKQRILNRIDIYPKGADFRPQGCISPPQRWQELKQPAQ